MAPARQELVDEVGRALQRYQRSTEAFDDAVGRWLALNPADRRCLDRLTDGPSTAGQLSGATGLRPAATTALVDRLSARGLVRRVRSDGDRRVVLVELTPEGRERVWAAYGPLVEEGQALLDGLDDDDLRRLGRLLLDMRDLTDRHRVRVEREPTAGA